MAGGVSRVGRAAHAMGYRGYFSTDAVLTAVRPALPHQDQRFVEADPPICMRSLDARVLAPGAARPAGAAGTVRLDRAVLRRPRVESARPRGPQLGQRRRPGLGRRADQPTCGPTGASASASWPRTSESSPDDRSSAGSPSCSPRPSPDGVQLADHMRCRSEPATAAMTTTGTDRVPGLPHPELPAPYANPPYAKRGSQMTNRLQLHSHDDFTPLREIIVGSARELPVPRPGRDLRAVPLREPGRVQHRGWAYPRLVTAEGGRPAGSARIKKRYTEELHEDVEELAEVLHRARRHRAPAAAAATGEFGRTSRAWAGRPCPRRR